MKLPRPRKLNLRLLSQAGNSRGAGAGSYPMAALLILCACLAGCSRTAPYPIEPGALAPAFSLDSLAGERVSLGDMRQHGMVLVNFWATWCALCKTEVPLLNKINQDFKSQRLTVVAGS